MHAASRDFEETGRGISETPLQADRESIAARICCVVRAVAERTAEECRRLLSAEVRGVAEVHVVGNKPFPETLADSLRAGLESGRAWTLCVDADVLPFPGAVAALVAEAERLEPTIVEVQPLVFDRFFGGWRPAGVHLYRTCHLGRALDALAQVRSLIRPETAMLERLAEEGLPWKQTTVEFGVHDFEQAPADVYRKCFVHARKHADLRLALERYWSARAPAEPDFTVALQGLRAGGAHAGPIELDASAEYLRFGSDRPGAGPGSLGSADAMRLLEREESVLASLTPGVAPVWDWIDAVWAVETQARSTLDRLMRDLLAAGPAPCLVEGADARTRVLLKVAAEWGVPITGVLVRGGLPRRAFCGVPVVAIPGLDEHGQFVVRRGEDGRCTLLHHGKQLMEARGADLPSSPVPQTPFDAVERTTRRLLAAQIGRIAIYGAGALGVEVARAFQRVGQVAVFIESDPSRLTSAPECAPVLDPERAIAKHAGIDVVIASMGSARAMVRRLLAASQTTGHWPGRIWLMDTP